MTSHFIISRRLAVDHQEPEYGSNAVISQSVSTQSKLATDPILKQVEKLSSLLAEKHDLNLAANREASGSGRNKTL